MHPKASIIFVLLASALASQSALAKSTDRSLPANIACDHWETAGNTTICTGNVVIDQGSLHIEAQKAVVHRGGGAAGIGKIELTGSPVRWQEVMDTCERVDANAREINYDLASAKVSLAGNVLIDKGQDQYSGDTIIYDLNARSFSGGGGENGRVSMRIAPPSESAPASNSPEKDC